MRDSATKLWQRMVAMKKIVIVGALFIVGITVVYQIGNLLDFFVCDYFLTDSVCRRRLRFVM